MKRFLMIILGKFAKTHSKEIKKAQSWIDSAQAQFASAIEEAELAEKQFEQVKEAKMALIENAIQEVKELDKKQKEASIFKSKVKKFMEE